jgi:hypothetical protein
MASFSERLYNFSERDTPMIRRVRGYIEDRHPIWLGRIDHLVAGRAWQLGGPMNGQRARSRLLLRIALAESFGAVVETGTFLGSTTESLHFIFGVPVWTAELRPRYWAFAAHRLQGLNDIHLFLGDSRELLDRLSTQQELTSLPTFFYLDAHWYSGLPLWEEITLILERWERVVILVDDFQVPDDDGYGFDDYGPGARLCLEDMRSNVRAPGEVVFPSIPSECETGAKRGYCFVGKPGFAERLIDLRLTAPLSLAGGPVAPPDPSNS